MNFWRILTIASITFLAVSATATAGLIRYELPQLVGEYRFDGESDSISRRVAHIETPFGFYAVSEARLVVQGRVTPGKGHGDGTVRENIEFDLVPSVVQGASFPSGHILGFHGQPTPEQFRIETIYANPFAPQTIPLPNPLGYPPVSFDVQLAVGPSISTYATGYPMPLAPRPDFLMAMDGIIIDVPIVAEIERAFILLQGPSIIPEPSSGVVVILGAVGLLLAKVYSAGR